MSQYNNVSSISNISGIGSVNNNIMINRISPQPAQKTTQTAPKTGESFENVLNRTMDEASGLQFSKHASQRLSTRDINLSSEQIGRVAKGVDEASEKGIKDSLVLVDGVALLVNVSSRTVVTLMNSRSKNVFTNIDGAVIV